MSFGGNLWPINLVDMSTQISSGSNPICQGSIFDLSLGTDNVGPGPDWVVGDTFLVRNISRFVLLSHISVLFSRKMYTRSSVQVQRLLGLPSCLMRLVDQVRNSLGQSRAYIYSHLILLQARLPRALALISRVCVPFSVGRYYFFLCFPPSGAMSTTIPAFLMLSTSFIAVIMLCL